MKSFRSFFKAALVVMSLAVVFSCRKGEEASIAVSTVNLSATTLHLQVGETRQLTATVLPVNATEQSLTWSSTNPYRVSVDNNGLVTALSQGTAYVTAKAANGVRSSCLVTVTSPSSYQVSILGPGAQAETEWFSYPGGSLALTATTDDGKEHTFSWSASGTAVRVSGGNVTFQSGDKDGKPDYAYYGESAVKVTTEDGNGASVKCVSSLSNHFYAGTMKGAFGSQIYLAAGASCTIRLQYFDGAQLADIPAGAFTLRVEDTSLATVSANTITALSLAGDTNVTATIAGESLNLCTISVVSNKDLEGSLEIWQDEQI